MSTPRKSLGAAFAIALAAGTVSVIAPTASAAPDGSNVVINEVYGGGGNTGSVFSNDFVELYNPTGKDIDVTGWVLDQQSASGGSGSKTTLSGIVPAGAYYLIQGQAGSNATGDLPTPDVTNDKMAFGAKAAIAVLFNGDAEVDRVGWGSATKPEGSAAAGTSNSTSIQRKAAGVDTDNNADDFEVASPTPKNSGNAGGTPVDPVPTDPDPAPQPQPDAITPIADIQGTGAASPLVGQTVATEGVVTAVYDEGGKKGFFLQTAGTGAVKNPGDASDGIFIYMGTRTDYPMRGDSLRVSGKVSEYFDQTQITASAIEKLTEALAAPKAVEIDTLPAGDDAREPYEGMLVRPKGPYTVTNNYTLNNTGDLGLAPGTLAHRTPTDVVAPGAPANELQATQDAEVVYLDDGRTANYFRTDKDTPLPYLVTSDKGIKSIRTGDQVQFQTDVVVDYSFNQWRFQPLQPVTGKNAAEELPISWEDSRAGAYNDIDNVAGDYSIGFFNVLNYFSTLGRDVSGCKAYNDMYGTPVAANNCTVRGAFSQDAFQDQQAKIVTAINKLDANVLGLSEIENTATVTGDVAKRDEALQNLVDALNEKEPGKWDLVKSPQNLGSDEDFIRVGFIYQPAKVKPVGESVIFDDAAFTRTARQPLAQEFDTVGNDQDKNFVAVVNHFKSKGSVAKGDADTGDGQGNNANVRKSQSEALLKHLGAQTKWADLPTFLVGDFNTYTKEDAITSLVDGGFTLVESDKDFDQASYQFGGQLGTLDHVLANAAAMEMVKDSVVWNINGDESAAFEYSRRNYNAQDFFGEGADPLYGYGNPFRSSDHDPVKVGFSAALDEKDANKFAPEADEAVTVTQGDALPEAIIAIKDADALPEGTKFEWTKPADTATVGDGQEGEITVTYPDNSTDTVKIVVHVKPKVEEEKPRFMVKAEIKDGDLVVTYDNGETENLGKVTGEDGAAGADGPKGDTGAQGPAGKDGKDGRDGTDGQQGPKGDKGDTGAQGPKGDKGDTGAQGPAGKDGKDGRDGTDGQQGPKGDKGDTGAQGPAGKNGKDGADGKDGQQGPKGDTGAQGPAGKDGQQGPKGDTGAQGPKGDKGDTGAQGPAGKNGKDGADGTDGRGVKSFVVNDEGHLIVTYSDGETADLGKVTGENGAGGEQGPKGDTGAQGPAGKDGRDGADGKDGRGIVNLEVDEDGELIATYTDGETQNLGRVTGADGKDGKDGKDGVNAPAPAGEGSSVSDRCLPGVGIMALPLLALIPLGLATTMDIPALAPVKEQINAVGASMQNQLPMSREMLHVAGVAGTAMAIAAIATLATLCSTEGGSSK